MATLPKIPTNTTIDQLLGDVMPKVAKDQLAASKSSAELAGTEITMVVDIEGKKFSYVLKNGSDMEAKKDDIANAMLRLKISADHLNKMIATENLDMLLGIVNDLNKAKYNALKSLKGSFKAEVAAPDGTVFVIYAILNGAEQPNSVFKMSAADTAALMRKETNPVNLFMSGAMKIDGDMSFAMATQPLFT